MLGAKVKGSYYIDPVYWVGSLWRARYGDEENAELARITANARAAEESCYTFTFRMPYKS